MTEEKVYYFVQRTQYEIRKEWFFFSPPTLIDPEQRYHHLSHHPRTSTYTESETNYMRQNSPKQERRGFFPPPPSHDPEQRHHIIYHIIPLYLHKENFMRQKEIPALVLFFFFFPRSRAAVNHIINHQIILNPLITLLAYLPIQTHTHTNLTSPLPSPLPTCRFIKLEKTFYPKKKKKPSRSVNKNK